MSLNRQKIVKDVGSYDAAGGKKGTRKESKKGTTGKRSGKTSAARRAVGRELQQVKDVIYGTGENSKRGNKSLERTCEQGSGISPETTIRCAQESRESRNT